MAKPKRRRECPENPTGLHDWQPDEEYAQKHRCAAPIVCAWCGAARPPRRLDLTGTLALELRLKLERARALLVECNQHLHDERVRRLIGHLQNVGDELEHGISDWGSNPLVRRHRVKVVLPDDQE
jgi:hypothetical protein